MALFALSAYGQDPVPTAWPNKYFAAFTTNKTRLSDKAPLGYTSNTLRWYNWDIYAMKNIEAHPDGVANTTLFLGKDAWIYNDFIRLCIKFTLSVTVVTPNWMIGGSYVGRQVADGVETDVWDKQDHIYYQSIVGTPQPKLVDAPIDQEGNNPVTHWSVFEEIVRMPSDTFAVPSYCVLGNPMYHEESNSTSIAGAVLSPWGWL